MEWWYPYLWGTPLAASIYQGLIKVNGMEADSRIDVGPVVSSTTPSGGESGGGGSSVTLTNLRGDFGVASVGYAVIFSAGSTQAGTGERGQGSQQGTVQGAGETAGRTQASQTATALTRPSERSGATTARSRNRAASEVFISRPVEVNPSCHSRKRN